MGRQMRVEAEPAELQDLFRAADSCGLDLRAETQQHFFRAVNVGG